jgi:hypothetical protein
MGVPLLYINPLKPNLVKIIFKNSSPKLKENTTDFRDNDQFVNAVKGNELWLLW